MQQGDRIHHIATGDAAVLRASHVFPTVADALAQVLHVGLPALEYGIALHLSTGARCGASDVAVTLSLPSLAWDITRATTLCTPCDVAASRRRHDACHGRVPLDLFEQLAAVCEELRVEAQLCVNAATATDGGNSSRSVEHGQCHREGLGESVSARQDTITLLPVLHWRRGVALAPGAATIRYPEPAQCRGAQVRLVTQCRVRGLFFNMAVRRAPFACLLECTRSVACGGSSEKPRRSDPAPLAEAHNNGADLPFRRAPVGNTASAARARREQQQHILTACFQAAVCTVLAPLYLGDAGTEDRDRTQPSCVAEDPLARQPAARFTLTFTHDELDGSLWVEGCSTAHALRQRRSASAPRTDAHPLRSLSGGDEAARPAATLRADGYGVFTGTIRVAQVAARATGQRWHRTAGGRTAQLLCDAFDIRLPPTCLPRGGGFYRTHNAGTAHPTHVAAGGDLLEVVVRRGTFAVLFWVPPGSSQLHPATAAAVGAVPARSAATLIGCSPTDASVMILVRRLLPTTPSPVAAGEASRSSLGAAATCSGEFCVLEPTHWAYDVVASLTQRQQHVRRRGHGPSSVVAPVFIFADAAFVPEHLYQARHRCRDDSTSAYHRFAGLFASALERANGRSSDGPGAQGAAAGCAGRWEVMRDDSGSASVVAAQAGATFSSAAAACCAGAPLQLQTAQVEARLRYLSQSLLEAAGGSGALPRRPPCAAAGTTPSGGLHHVRLRPASILLAGRGGWNAAAATAPSGPRRTPVSLDPHLHRVLIEEEAVLASNPSTRTQSGGRGAAAAPSRDASAAAAGLARMRRLLDTGRGSVLRQLPRAFALPAAWRPPAAPHASAAPVSDEGGRPPAPAPAAPHSLPPIGAALTSRVSVTQWARKFVVLASPREGAAAAAAAAAPTSSACTPHARQWWVADQHAVHERVRLEFFLCFADTYVCHPEMPPVWRSGGAARAEAVAGGGRAAAPSCEAREALQRRHRIARLLRSLAEPRERGTPSPGRAVGCGSPIPAAGAAAQSFRVSLPADLRCRVAAVEPHLRQWGWRLEHVGCSAAVVAWPRLEVEGVVRHVASLEALRHTVEELEAVGSAAASCPLLVPSVFLEFFVSRSCRGAVMFGDRLQPSAARCMMAALDCVEQYYVCSHGRPSFAQLRARV